MPRILNDEGEEVPEPAESFETAKPVSVRAGKKAAIERNGVIRGHGPNGTDPEDYLIGACLLDEGPTLDRAMQAGVTTTDLTNQRRVTVFSALRHMRESGIPIGLDTLVTELGPRLPDAGGLAELMALADPVKLGTTLHADHYIRLILDRANRRRIILKAKDTIERAERGEEMEGMEPPARTKARGLFEFSLVQDGDPSILLGNRYLNRGDGAVISSTSGMGKSTICLQGAAELALNLGPFGIQGNGFLKSLIVQSEDSDGDVAEVAYSLKHVLKLTEAQIADVNSRVRVVTDRVSRGLRFIARLKALIAEFKPDLVWINPFQAFIDGDVTDSKALGQFLREGLNSLNDPPTFGYIIIHHTTKPATGKDRAERLWHEVMYDMAGGAELINWARAILSLRATPEEGNFNLVLAKRGRRAGVTRKTPQGVGYILEPVTTIPLKHATGRIDVPGIKAGMPLIYWEGREADAKPEPTGKSSGRPEKFRFCDYRNLFPPHATKGIPLNELYKALMPNGEIQKKNLHAVCERWQEQGEVEIIDQAGQPRRYRAAV